MLSYRIVHVVVVVQRFRRDRLKNHVIRRVSGSGFARWRLTVLVTDSGVCVSVAYAVKYDVENFQQSYETSAEEQRQQAAHVTWSHATTMLSHKSILIFIQMLTTLHTCVTC